MYQMGFNVFLNHVFYKYTNTIKQMFGFWSGLL